MKAVLISIQPQWCEKIFNGEKTIEVRKTAPKIEMPFTVYVYQTKIKGKKGDSFMVVDALNENLGCGKVIGSFVCDSVEEYEGEFWDDDTYERIQEPWEPSDFAEYGEYEYDTIGENGEFYGKGIELSKQSCLSWNELRKYVGQGLKDFYGWHIIEPKLFDKPRDLGEFKHKIKVPWAWQENGKAIGYFYKWQPITRAPQSWVYCETIDEK